MIRRVLRVETWTVCAALFGALGLVPASAIAGSLVSFDLEATSVSGGPTPPPTPKLVTGVGPGSVIHLSLYAILHGAQANDGVVQVVGNLNDSAGQIVGSFSASNDSAYSAGPGTQPGTQVAAADGSREIGSEAYWTQGASDAITGNTYLVDAAPGAASFIPVTGVPDASGDLKLLLGTADYTVATVNGPTQLYFFPHLRTDGDSSQQQNQQFVIGGVQYRFDGAGSDPALDITGGIDLYQPVTIYVPEPCMIGLLGAGGVGLLFRRRRAGR